MTDELNVGDWVIFPMRGLLAFDPVGIRIAEIDGESVVTEQHFRWGQMKAKQPMAHLTAQMRQFEHHHIRPDGEQ